LIRGLKQKEDITIVNKPGMVAHAYNPGGKRIMNSRPAWAKLARPVSKTK
jgi:hypothetical protein